MVEQYLKHSKEILSSERSEFKFNERRGVGRISLFGYMNVHDLREGFPLLTTKRVGFKTVAHELRWFLQGDTNIKYLVDNNVGIWNDDSFNFNLDGMVREGIFPESFPRYSEPWVVARDKYVQRLKEDSGFAQRWGNLGPVYGSQWIHWPNFVPARVKINVGGEERDVYFKDSKGIDQIAAVIQGMKKNVTSARHIVSAWNPQEVPEMALPPCHTLFQLNSDGENLDLQLYQRACDMFLGVPFNIASYSMLTTVLAQQLELKPRHFVHAFGDVHFYCGAGERAKWYRDNLDEFKERVRGCSGGEDFSNLLAWLDKRLPPEDKGREGMDHVTGILEQLTREPMERPTLRIADKPYNKLTISDFSLENYKHHPQIDRTLIVG